MYNLSGINAGSVSLSSGGLAAGTNAGTFKTSSTLTYTINGIFKSKAATDNLAVAAGTKLTASKACLLGVFIDGAGALSTTQGPIVDAGDPCPVPGFPAGDVALVGLIKVVTNASNEFTPGTTAFGATGVTATYLNCMTMPGSAQ